MNRKGGDADGSKEDRKFPESPSEGKGDHTGAARGNAGVSGRTVSRWETGVNMPDLGVLIELSEYYETDIKEILDGERRRGDMDKEMKETLIKVADYNEMERGKAMKAGNTAFGIMFFLCVFFIVIQLILTGDLRITMGETAVLCAGGIAYIGIIGSPGAMGFERKNKKLSLFRQFDQCAMCGAFFFAALHCTSSKRSRRACGSAGGSDIFRRDWDHRVYSAEIAGIFQ